MLDAREEVMSVRHERSADTGRRRSKEILTVEIVSARRAEAQELGTLAETATASVAVPVRTAPATDGEAALRHARIGLFAALTLVLILVWTMQRRKDAVR